jgi:hypothetical protein
VKGPSTTLNFPPERRTRAPNALGKQPSVASSLGGLHGVLNQLPHRGHFLLGGRGALRLAGFIDTQEFHRYVLCCSSSRLGLGWLNPGSTYTSNRAERNRHRFNIFCRML